MKINFLGKCLVIEFEKKKVLVIGDLHLGYEEMLNKSGIFISREMYNEIIEEFDKVFLEVGVVDEIVLLGDVKHEFSKNSRQEWKDVINLINYFREKISENGKIIVVRGNHDNYLKTIAGKIGIEVLDFYFVENTCFMHGDRDFDELHDKKIKYWIIGHVHPAVKISDSVKVEKYKCFLVGKFKGKEIIIVPSFFNFSEGSDPRESYVNIPWKFDLNKFNVKVVSDDLNVLDFGILKDLN